MNSSGNSWRHKLADDKDLPRIEPIPEKLEPKLGRGRIVTPAPREVDAIMRLVPHGKLITIERIAAAIAAHHGVEAACPMSTGIFVWIAANAADEAQRAGHPEPTPFWRTIKDDGEINPKYPGNFGALIAKIESEGHKVTRKGMRAFVEAFQPSLCDLPAPAIATAK
jgi:hypothetical protein